jgi:hypothetical protein
MTRQLSFKIEDDPVERSKGRAFHYAPSCNSRFNTYRSTPSKAMSSRRSSPFWPGDCHYSERDRQSRPPKYSSVFRTTSPALTEVADVQCMPEIDRYLRGAKSPMRPICTSQVYSHQRVNETDLCLGWSFLFFFFVRLIALRSLAACWKRCTDTD